MDGSPMQEPPVGRASPPNETSAPWPLWQRITFRFLLVYYLLYAFPRPLSNLIGTGAGVIAMVAGQADAGESTAWVEQAPWRWPGKWQKQLGHVEVWRQSATTWLDQHHLAPLEVIHQRTGSGDTAHDIALVLADLFAAALLTGLWSVLRRRPCGYPRLGRWLHVVVRFDLAFWLLSYGCAKLYGSQFGELSLTRLTQEIAAGAGFP